MPILAQRPPAASGTPCTSPASFPTPSDRQRINGLRCQWRLLARLLADPAVELDTDEFAAVLDVYTRLKAAGAEVDPMAEAFILQDCQQMVAASL